MLPETNLLVAMVGVLVSALLMWIRSDIKAQREDTRELRSETSKLRSEMVAGLEAQRSETNQQRVETAAGFAEQRAETNRGFDRVDGKLDKITDKLSGHGERIARLEGQAGIPDPPADEAQAA